MNEYSKENPGMVEKDKKIKTVKIIKKVYMINIRAA